MKAIVYHRYGPPHVLQAADVAKPSPQAGEVLIRIRATTVTAGDWRMRKAEPVAARLYNGLLRPRKVNILGFECAGDVVALGCGAARFSEGDAVFAFAGITFGCYAEYIALPEAQVAAKPAGLSYEEAAALPVGGLTALAFLRQAGVGAGQRVLIYGASGSVGTYAVQIAKAWGAHVTGVCSTGNVALVQSLGADQVIDYTAKAFDAGAAHYDCVFDAVGLAGRRRCRRILAPGGHYASVRGNAPVDSDNLWTLKELVEAQQLRPIIDRRYRLDEVAAAHVYVQSYRKKGNVAVTVA